MSKWIVRNAGGRNNIVYHTDKNCTHVAHDDTLSEASQAFIEFHDARECQRCSGDEQGQTDSRDVYEAALEWAQ